MPWAKGQSGNPGGRPKALVEVQELARRETAASIAALVRIRDAEDCPPAAVVAAATALLDRGWGKPAQTISGDTNAPLIVDFRWMGDAPDAITPVTIEADAAPAEDEPVLTWSSSC